MIIMIIIIINYSTNWLGWLLSSSASLVSSRLLPPSSPLYFPRQGHPADLAAVALSLEVNNALLIKALKIFNILSYFTRHLNKLLLMHFLHFDLIVEVSGSPAREAAFQLLSKYRQVLIIIMISK